MNKLSSAQKKVLAEQIKALDPRGEIVALSPNSDFTGGTIRYNAESGIVLGENITRLKDEEYVRAWLVVRLIHKLGYPTSSVELEKTYTIGRPSPTRAQIDIRIHDKRRSRSQVYMLVETKRPDDFDSYVNLIEDQLFATGRDEHSRGLRYIAWYTVEFNGDEPRDRCIVVDFRKFTEHRAWVEAGEPGHNLDLPVEYGTLRKTKYVRGKTDLRTDLTREELTKLQKDFHNRLWGGAKMGDADIFNNLLKMFIAKIYDEKTTEEGKAYRFQTEIKDGSPESAEDILTKVDKLYQEALRRYFNYDADALRAATIQKEKFKPEKVAYVMERLESISITENQFEDDVLGVFFEAIVRTGFKQEKGQFFTHTNIVRFILYALELDTWVIERVNSGNPSIPYVIDPSCGSGTFLIEAMKLMTQAVVQPRQGALKPGSSRMVKDYVAEWFQPYAASKNIQNRWAREFVFGIEDNEDLALATKVNMILHGDGNANIQKGDGLSALDKYQIARLKSAVSSQNHPYKLDRNEQFDAVISNPPFSLKEDPRTLAEYKGRFLYAEKKNSENLFIERWYQLLKPGGRMGVVLPDSVFDTNENLYIRLFLYRFFFLKAVVSLPQVTFQPYTPTKTSLLFAVKKTNSEVRQWDDAWREASREYKKLRDSNLVKSILTNDRLRNGLIDLASRNEIEWYPPLSLLQKSSLPASVRSSLEEAVAASPSTKRRLALLLGEFNAYTKIDPVAAFSDRSEKEARAILARLLRDKSPGTSEKMSIRDLLESTYDDIVSAAELNYTEDPRGQPYCNAWWCFAEVTSKKDHDYTIFFAEAEHVGYKRTTRHPEGIDRPNDLFRLADGKIVTDSGNDKPQSILEALRLLHSYG